MNVLSKIQLWLVLLSVVTLGCNMKEDDKAVITIQSTTQFNADVKISIYKNLDQTTLLESKTDSAGFSSFELVVHKPILVSILIGKKYGEAYLSPGSNLVIRDNGEDYLVPMTFSGKGAEINNYISWVKSNVEKIKWVNGIGIGALDLPEFLRRFDSLKTTLHNFHEHYLDSVTLTNETISMLEKRNKVILLEVSEEYKFYVLNNKVNEKWDAYRSGRNYIEGNVLKELEKLTNEIPFDTALLADGYYQVLLNFHWHNAVNLPVAEEIIGPKDSINRVALMTNARIQKGTYPEGIREFLLAFNFQYWLLSFGITPETDTVFAGFKRNYPNSKYLPTLNKGYDEWLAINPGSPAPEFAGYTPDGKKISIKDLRGKIVYIDVWATWCGPCVAEIPASKKLQNEMKDSDQVQFLNISVDSKRPDWEAFLAKDNAWKGLHIIIEPEMIQPLYTSYKLSGVPAYILIDQSGNIVNMKASRPSEGKAKEEITQLLAKSL